MENLDEKMVTLVTKTDLTRLTTLAENNTSGNKAELVRRVLRLAMRNPEKFGLLDEKNNEND